MTHLEIVKKLIGNINPVGKTEVDAQRLINLNDMCNLTQLLILEIESVAHNSKGSYEHSVKVIHDRADSFMKNTLKELTQP